MDIQQQYLGRRHSRGVRGFSLIEVLFVLFIVGILSVIAIPSYKRYIATTRIAGHAQFVVETLRLARLEVFMRKVTVGLCASSDGKDCTGSRWENGWIVYTDEGAPGTVDGSDEVLRRVPAFKGGTTFDVVVTGNKGVDYVQLRPDAIQLVGCVNCTDAHAHPRLYADIGRWAGDTLLTLLGISDAVAFESGCSDQDASNNPNSEQCNKSKKTLATFTLCDSGTHGETGQRVSVTSTGFTTVANVRCD
jgi:prepilin-type N-terminal cleavage/methylation domain-containing protein